MKKEFKKNKIAKLYDSIASEYDLFMDQTGHQQAQKKILQKFYYELKGKVLEVATGTGFLAQNIKANCKDAEITGIDISKEMIERARLNARQRGLEIKFLVADAEKLFFLDETFNVVICSLGFLWFVNKDRVFKELKRVLKKRGEIIIIEEEGEAVRSGDEAKKFSPRLRSFFSQIENIETPISLKEIKNKLESFFCQFKREYRVPIDKNHCFVAMVFKT